MMSMSNQSRVSAGEKKSNRGSQETRAARSGTTSWRFALVAGVLVLNAVCPGEALRVKEGGVVAVNNPEVLVPGVTSPQQSRNRTQVVRTDESLVCLNVDKDMSENIPMFKQLLDSGFVSASKDDLTHILPSVFKFLKASEETQAEERVSTVQSFVDKCTKGVEFKVEESPELGMGPDLVTGETPIIKSDEKYVHITLSCA
jgi:hypothetical protein